MTEATAWIHALRTSHERFRDLLSPLDDEAVNAASFDPGWSIAQVASHLGSQAEIFGLFLEAGLTGHASPGADQFGPIWDRWNAKPPTQQVADSIEANLQFVASLEHLEATEREAFATELFGDRTDLSRLASMRLGEHALHTWDVAVALDPSATVLPDAVELLIDLMPTTAGQIGRPTPAPRTVLVCTTEPGRRFVLTTGPDVILAPADAPSTEPDLQLPAEALVRLVYGRLDPAHTPHDLVGAPLLTQLRPVFPGI